MEHIIVAAPHYEILERIYIITATIKTFKGRRDVEIHLFKTNPDTSELKFLSNMKLVDVDNNTNAVSNIKEATDDALRSVLEAFTAKEGNLLLEFLDDKYNDQISKVLVCPLEIPIPMGIIPLSAIPQGKTMGFIHFDETKNYSLPFAVWGFYDLDAHDPLVQEE